MSKTAYSILNKKELDVEQLLALYGNHSVEESIQILADIPDHIRTMVSMDVQCPSCGVDGAILVSGAKSKTTAKALRQAHFRFVGAKNEDAHLPFCEFNTLASDLPKQSELVDLQSDRSQETRQVRQLVCKGIEGGVFDQSNIRSMRQWYFELKTSVRFRVTASTDTFNYLYDLLGTHPHDSLVHHPSHAEIPNFDWRHAAKVKLTLDQADLVEEARGIRFGDSRKDAIRLAERYKDCEVFDVSALEPYYQKTIQLSMFTARALGYKAHTWMNYKFGKVSSPLLAFCSLLLSSSEWDLNVAIEKLSIILGMPEPKNFLHGNIIGLNPFIDYNAWRTIKKVCEIGTTFSIPNNFTSRIKEIEAEMRAEHLRWRKEKGLPEKPMETTKKLVWPPETKSPY
ncbi:hypothetical protein EJA70_09960 [Pseudomonas sp. PB103]|uniref:hypothetical protein n=1 Tax=unclassified Pseudomonas TaxID=196821 RepID=UPI00131BA385|nr:MULTISPECIES: hypothetical protein [unclassified Pseudomonas]KAE9645641.1 hypothetical protein EJA70_09960 [Pseudomonas sp. PB103]